MIVLREDGKYFRKQNVDLAKVQNTLIVLSNDALANWLLSLGLI